MKFLGIIAVSLIILNLTGCYTVVYQSVDTEIVYIEPIYIPIPVPVPDPYPMPGPYPHPVPDNPPEKIRHPENGDKGRDDSYSERDPLRNTGGRGSDERRNQGR